MSKAGGRYSTAAARWAGVGPYYAMFPAAFADKVVLRYTKPGDAVLDPFTGRGTSVFSAAVHNRRGIGIEINPVGWVYSATKLRPASEERVATRLLELAASAYRYRKTAAGMPEFFRWCYQPNVLEFLLAARAQLDWRGRRTDRTLMSFLLINMHGKRHGSLSNQMRQTKSMSPAYAVRWWRRRRLKPPELDPVEFLLTRLAWRYAKGFPQFNDSAVFLGDSTSVLPRMLAYRSERERRPRLLLTSPPYYGITNYHYDQWLRLWLLGGAATPKRVGGRHRGKFENKEEYRDLLVRVFANAKAMLARDATVYVRTDHRKLTLGVTSSVLREVFPNHRLRRKSRPCNQPTQTRLFGQVEPRLGEVDLILTR